MTKSIHQQIIEGLDFGSSKYGLIYHSYGHFYYIWDVVTNEKYTLTLPTRQQKEGIKAYVGDIVEFCSRDCVVINVLPRHTLLDKPKAANVDQVLAVIAAAEPEPDFEHFNRLVALAHIQVPHSRPLICITKTDLNKDIKDLLIYEELGYEIIQISNMRKEGLEPLYKYLHNKTTVVAGKSGVGKSTLLNNICSGLELKTGKVSDRTGAGMHTTRTIELFRGVYGDYEFQILDTPGFSRLNTEFSVEKFLNSQAFVEISMATDSCFFQNCTHSGEEGCRVQMSDMRYQTYQKLLEEARDWESLERENQKVKLDNSAQRTKEVKNKSVPLLQGKQRQVSRRRQRQEEIDLEEVLSDEY